MGFQNLFTMALKSIQDRQEIITWAPKEKKRRLVPSLEQIAMEAFINDVMRMVSVQELDKYNGKVALKDLPYNLMGELIPYFWFPGTIPEHFLKLLVSGSPKEICLEDFSWLEEEHVTKYFQDCDTGELRVLQLGMGGPGLRNLLATLAKKGLPKLNVLSLTHPIDLDDKDLEFIIHSCPKLRSINLSSCSMLKPDNLSTLATSVEFLKELYIDKCPLLAGEILPPLKSMEHLEVLSLVDIKSIDDEFVREYTVARGGNLKELVVKYCKKLTDASVKDIAEHCPGLHTLDLGYLVKLSDLSLEYLTNSCQALHTLKLQRNPFSDEAIAAFLEVIGFSLVELSLNSILKVGHQTTLSLALCAKKLHTLDLSYCENLTNCEMGFIVDHCCSLKTLKICGCRKVTEDFIYGNSNPHIEICRSAAFSKKKSVGQRLELDSRTFALANGVSNIHTFNEEYTHLNRHQHVEEFDSYYLRLA